MSFFNIIFGYKKAKPQSEQLFVSSEELRAALYNLGTLDSAQMNLVIKVIEPYLLSGQGVSRNEFKESVLPKLYNLTRENKLSETDYFKIKGLLNE